MRCWGEMISYKWLKFNGVSLMTRIEN